MRVKVTWDVVFEDFKQRYPRLRQTVVYWQPSGYGSISLYFKDGRKGTYDHSAGRLIFSSESWIKKN